VAGSRHAAGPLTGLMAGGVGPVTPEMKGVVTLRCWLMTKAPIVATISVANMALPIIREFALRPRTEARLASLPEGRLRVIAALPRRWGPQNRGRRPARGDRSGRARP